jgi:preprotein translocase subunit SecE
MATDDKKDELETKAGRASSDEPAAEPDGPAPGESIVKAQDAGGRDEGRDEGSESSNAGDHDEIAGAGAIQFGTRRFVYASYFAGAIGIAFLGTKVVSLVWGRVEAWKPEVGDPNENIIIPIAAIVGGLVAFYYWRRQATRQYAEEVASELAQVTWPSRAEVTNSTTVVIIATAFATIFFALMDRFWAFLTDLVYRF